MKRDSAYGDVALGIESAMPSGFRMPRSAAPAGWRSRILIRIRRIARRVVLHNRLRPSRR